MLLVRIPGQYSVEDSGGQPPSVYRQALWCLFGSLAALELRNDNLNSLALPLLGATRGYAIREVMRAILEQSLNWLRASRFMNTINFYLLDQPHIDEWTAAMDDVLGRKFVDSAQNEVIHALRDEILANLTAGALDELSPSMELDLDGLRESLREQRISLERVAAAARRLMESIVDALLREQGVAHPKSDLYHKINQLRDANLTAPWIISHFQSLRAFGNAGVHGVSEHVLYRPTGLRDEDLVAILASIQRVLSFATTRA
jgi:hypothetical protein